MLNAVKQRAIKATIILRLPTYQDWLISNINDTYITSDNNNSYNNNDNSKNSQQWQQQQLQQQQQEWKQQPWQQYWTMETYNVQDH